MNASILELFWFQTQGQTFKTSTVHGIDVISSLITIEIPQMKKREKGFQNIRHFEIREIREKEQQVGRKKSSNSIFLIVDRLINIKLIKIESKVNT